MLMAAWRLRGCLEVDLGIGRVPAGREIAWWLPGGWEVAWRLPGGWKIAWMLGGCLDVAVVGMLGGSVA